MLSLFLAKVTAHTPSNHYCTVQRIIVDPVSGDTTDGVDITDVWVASGVDLTGRKVLVAPTGIEDRPYMVLWTDAQNEDEYSGATNDCTS